MCKDSDNLSASTKPSSTQPLQVDVSAVANVSSVDDENAPLL